MNVLEFTKAPRLKKGSKRSETEGYLKALEDVDEILSAVLETIDPSLNKTSRVATEFCAALRECLELLESHAKELWPDFDATEVGPNPEARQNEANRRFNKSAPG